LGSECCWLHAPPIASLQHTAFVMHLRSKVQKEERILLLFAPPVGRRSGIESRGFLHDWERRHTHKHIVARQRVGERFSLLFERGRISVEWFASCIVVGTENRSGYNLNIYQAAILQYNQCLPLNSNKKPGAAARSLCASTHTSPPLCALTHAILITTAVTIGNKNVCPTGLIFRPGESKFFHGHSNKHTFAIYFLILGQFCVSIFNGLVLHLVHKLPKLFLHFLSN